MNYIYDLHRTMMSQKLILVYQGEFTQETTKSILTMAERNLDSSGEESNIKRKVFNVMVEALQNIVKHSGASEASVTLSGNGNELQLTISDNGRGFDPKSPVPEASLGLTSLRERIRLLHGKMSINSRPDKGTRIEATIPV